MNHYEEGLHDPKGQGQPPAYTTNDSSQAMHPINNMQPQMHGTMGHQMYGAMGPQMYGAMGPQMHGGVGPQMHVGVGLQMNSTMMHASAGMMQPVGVIQPSGMMYSTPVVVPMVVGNQMGRQPAPATCPSCKEVIVTRVESKATIRTHIFAIMMVMICCLPCALIPYCTDTCRNADHYCPNCNSYIGTHVHQ